MKKVCLIPLYLIAGGAFGSTTFYYDSSENCSGLFLNANAQTCADAVTKVSVPVTANKSFAGYYVNGTRVIDGGGNVLIDGPTAATLMDSDFVASGEKGQAAYTSNKAITVMPGNKWNGESSGWYTCGSYGFHQCREGGDYYTPPAVTCWSSGTTPCDSSHQNCKYDYVFNSYRMADNEGKFYKGSCVRSGGCSNANGCWCNPYPNPNSSCPGMDDGQPDLNSNDCIFSTGSVSVENGCSVKLLGAVTDYDAGSEIVQNLSQWKIYPFACKKIKDGNNWVESYPVTNGSIVLDNSTAGKCKYKLVCNNRYVPQESSTKLNEVSCTGLECKGWFNGIISTLTSSKNLNSVCVEEQPAEFTCPTTTVSGLTINVGGATSVNGKCTYTVTCNDMIKTCQSSVSGADMNLCEPQACDGQENCQALLALYTEDNISCALVSQIIDEDQPTDD